MRNNLEISNMTRILYISYWGGLEPLGQSLILPALYKLSEMGSEITFVSFDKPHDLENKSEYERVKDEMRRYKVDWFPLRYHKNPRIPATLFDITHGVTRGILERIKKSHDVIHARCFVGGLIGMSLSNITGTKWIYHNEGFYPDEQVDGKFWKQNSWEHRTAKNLEIRMYSHANGIISLSNRARKVISKMPEVAKKKTPVVVVPSVVDLERFSFRGEMPSKDNLNLVYVGSMGGRYMTTEMARFVEIARQELNSNTKLHFQILSRMPKEEAISWIEPTGLPTEIWGIKSVPYIEMPQNLTPYHAGMLFLRQGISEHGCSPTKFGEYLARGLPLIITPNISDTDDIIRKENVGVVVEQHTDEAYRKAFLEFRELLKDPNLAQRCRNTAETYFALEPACERQLQLYDAVINNKQVEGIATKQLLD